MTKKHILPKDPEAATLKTITGWVSRNGRFLGDAEDLARWDGATHLVCECGTHVLKNSYTICNNCREKKENFKYKALPTEKWDLEKIVYSDSDGEYYTFDDLCDLDVNTLDELVGLRLKLTKEEKFRLLDEDYFDDQVVDDELPTKLLEAIADFNQVAMNTPSDRYSYIEIAVDNKALLADIKS